MAVRAGSCYKMLLGTGSGLGEQSAGWRPAPAAGATARGRNACGDSSRACECTPSTPCAHAPFRLSASYACCTRRAPVLVAHSPLVLRSLSLRHPRTDASTPARTARPPRRARTPRTPRPSPTHSSTTFFPFCTPPAPVPATHGRRVLALPMPPSPCTAGGFATLRTHFSSR